MFKRGIRCSNKCSDRYSDDAAIELVRRQIKKYSHEALWVSITIMDDFSTRPLVLTVIEGTSRTI